MSEPNSPLSRLSPSYKNLKLRNNNVQSPHEIKEKIRKSYKEKIHNARHSIFNNLRGISNEKNLHTALVDIYKSLFDFSHSTISDDEEIKLSTDIQEELVNEELEWWLEEYERCQNDNIDCYTMDYEDTVICPVCMKTNFLVNHQVVSCNTCNINIHTDKQLKEIKDIIQSSVGSHSNNCNAEVQFTTIAHSDSDTHIYLICRTCTEMQEII